jgi:radical SAM superfamily enzyme YgiQ (UPF0313 family)
MTSLKTFILVSIDSKKEQHCHYTPGIALILASLKDHEFIRTIPVVKDRRKVRISDLTNMLLRTIRTNVNREVIIGFSVFVWNEELVIKAVKELRKAGFAGRIIYGGASVTSSGPEIESELPGADCYVRGFAHEIIAPLILSDDRIPIKGVHWAYDEDKFQIAKIDTFPASPIQSGIYNDIEIDHFWLMTCIGCSYGCSFCLYDPEREKVKPIVGTLEQVRQEINWIVAQGIKTIKIIDPIFSDKKGRCVSILDLFLQARFKGEIHAECRLEFVTEAFLNKINQLKQAGIVFIPEFGLQTAIKTESRAINRQNNLATIVQKANLVKSKGISFKVSIIFGLPFQTVESFHETITFCRKLGIRDEDLLIFQLAVYRGTALNRSVEEFGIKTEKNEIRIDLVCETKWATRKDIKTMKRISKDVSGW